MNLGLILNSWELPFPPGDSPFHIKGHVYHGVLERMQHELPGGIAEALELLDEPLRAFFLKPMLSASWYDFLPFRPLTSAVARKFGVSQSQLLRESGELQAQRAATGVYRALLQNAPADVVLARLAQTTPLYFDFGHSEAKFPRPGVCTYLRKGAPEFMALWMAYSLEGIFTASLQMAGAKQVRVRWDPFIPDGEKRAVQLVTVPFEISWR